MSYRPADRDATQFVPGEIVRASLLRKAKTVEGEPPMMEFIPSKGQGILRIPSYVGSRVVAERCNDRLGSRERAAVTVQLEPSRLHADLAGRSDQM